MPPESLEIGWFSESEIPTVDLWEPGAKVNARLLFEGAEANRFDFLQQTADFSRLIGERGIIRYIWRNP